MNALGQNLRCTSFLPRKAGRWLAPLALLVLLVALAASAWPPIADPADEVQPPLSPTEEQATFDVAPGYRVELVAAEPLVEAPVAFAFDEDGRLWVVEMRGFMRDVEGTGEGDPLGRIAILTDTDGDGQMDQRTTFLDSLVLPRTIAPTRGGALVADQQQLYFARDLDGDGRADPLQVVDPDFAPGGNPEHDPNGMLRALDNWYYNAKSSARYRWDGDRLIRDTTEFRGQWGLSQDSQGRLYYNYNFSQLHTDLAPPGYLTRNPHHAPTSGLNVSLSGSQQVFPRRPTPAVNRGYIPGALDATGRIQEFTAAAAPFIYRGDAMEALRGDAFVCEPAANLVKRNQLEGDRLAPAARFAYEDREFIASTDERFRPVALADGPDGALYIADMYRGLIQHKVALTPYLREQTLERGLETPVDYGRIWRVVPETSPKPSRHATLSEASSEELVRLLADPNGWRRDAAQRLLVERDAQDVRPLLVQMALEGEEPLGRLHALWTLEGLGMPQPEALFPVLEDPDPHVQSAAIRVLEQLTRDDASMQQRLLEQLEALSGAPPVVQLQAVLTAGNLTGDGRLDVFERAITDHVGRPLFRDAVLSSLAPPEHGRLLERLWEHPGWAAESMPHAIFLEALASALVQHRQTSDVAALLDLLVPEEDSLTWRQQAMLSGLGVLATQRDFDPIPLAQPPALLADTALNPDVRAHADRLEQILTWPGHTPPARPALDVRPLTAEEEQLFLRGRQVHLTVCAGCHGSNGEGLAFLAPPLAESEWVQGPEDRLVRILLHGVEGPIEVAGTRYAPPDVQPEMPPMNGLDNESLAAVATYLRRAWGHNAEPVKPGTVGRLRFYTQGRLTPWTSEELLQPPPSGDPAQQTSRAQQ
ncbi:MAG: DUF7133 domain-containing protein [Rhodothermales bacterium]